MTSREARRVPASEEPKGLRQSASNLREYSSSMAARPIQINNLVIVAPGMEPHCYRMLSAHRM